MQLRAAIRPRATSLRPGAFFFTALVLPGCLWHDLELGAPQLEAHLALVADVDAASELLEHPDRVEAVADDPLRVRVGDGLIAVLRIDNTGENKASVPIPGVATTHILRLPMDRPDPIDVQFLDFVGDAPEFIEIAPGDSFVRAFIVPLATREAGAFRFLARYESELSEEMEGFVAVYADPVVVEVSPPRSFERADQGYIVRNDIERIARGILDRPVSNVSCELIRDTNWNVYVWHCTADLESPDDEGRTRVSFLIDAYLGDFRGYVEEHVGGGA